MAISSILLIAALLILVALFLVRPFLDESIEDGLSEDEGAALLAERERIIEALLELDFDQQLGKVPEEIYSGQRQRLLLKGAEILKELDKLGSTYRADADVDTDLEMIIAARKAEIS
jgi:hypothetical protein